MFCLVLFAFVLGAPQVFGQSVENCPASARNYGDKYVRVRGNICYEFVLHHIADYAYARASCSSDGGMLALVKSADVNTYLVDTLKNEFQYTGAGKYVWIGLNDYGGAQQEGRYQWEDGTYLNNATDFTNWAYNQRSYPSEDCVAISPNNGEWYEFECQVGFFSNYVFRVPFICQYDIPTPAPQVMSGCPAELTQSAHRYLRVHGDFCYQFVLNHPTTDYDAASASCDAYGGTLALVKTQDINDFLVDTLVKEFRYGNSLWIGLSDQGKTEDGNYHWEDGTFLGDTGYSNWAHLQGPSGGFLHEGFEDCIAMNPSDGGKWSDHKCLNSTSVYPGYICQFAKLSGNISPSTVAPTVSSTSFPQTNPPLTDAPTGSTAGMSSTVLTNAPTTLAPSPTTPAPSPTTAAAPTTAAPAPTTPAPSPTTPAPSPTTPAPSPTTAAAPTTPAPAPTTPAPAPTTAAPAPTMAQAPTTVKSP